MFIDLDYKILTIEEIRTVLEDLEIRRNSRSEKKAVNSWINLVIFRLSCCCGLRSKEIQHLRLDDLKLDGNKPFVRIREGATKGSGRGRRVPLWWDQSTLSDLREWKTYRLAGGFESEQCVRSPNQKSLMIKRNKLYNRWKQMMKPLGTQRHNELTIHSGRHTFISVALEMGKSLVAVQRAAGHTSITTTQVYMHLVENHEPTDIFGGNG